MNNRAPLPIFCGGLFGSASTWLFNLVFAIAEAHHGQRLQLKIARFYADEVEEFPDSCAVLSSDVMVIKTHVAGGSLEHLARETSGPMILTIREPRDALASLMMRFGYEFENDLSIFAQSAQKTVDLSHINSPLILRYEDRFFDRPETVETVADLLGASLHPAEATRIWETLRPEAVSKMIDEFQSLGVFGDAPARDAHDPDTLWHPRHIGDRNIGKFSRILTSDQQVDVLKATETYCTTFGYDIKLGA